MNMDLFTNRFPFLFPSFSLDLGKKSSIKSTKQELDMTRKWPFTFHNISNQSNSIVLDSFKKIHLHFLKFKFPFLNSIIVIELITWRINVLVYILVIIVESIIILQKDASYRRDLQEWIFTMVGSILGNGHQ